MKLDLQQLLIRIAGMPLRLIPAGMVVRVLTGLNAGRKWVRGSANAWEWIGVYEKEKQRAVAALIKPGMTVFDVGANAGFYTLAFSSLVGPSGRVVAFEPLPKNGAKILRHLQLNKVTNVALIQAALSEKNAILPFDFGASDFEGRLTGHASSHLLVPALCLDDLIRSGQCPVPNLLKIDVEGAEASVLRGMSHTMERYSPDLLIALHGLDQKAAVAELLKSCGYAVSRMDGMPIETGTEFPDEILAQRRKV